MRDVTLTLPLREHDICLAMKKRGFGAGKLNGFGGKPETGESPEDAAVRELDEEGGIRADASMLEKVAVIEFSFEGKPDWDQRMHVYLVREWDGEPVETEEMAPEWMPRSAIPYERMWIDDEFWLPRVLAGERLEGSFRFNEDGSEILKSELRVL